MDASKQEAANAVYAAVAALNTALAQAHKENLRASIRIGEVMEIGEHDMPKSLVNVRIYDLVRPTEPSFSKE